jgi:hypothetical protein
LKVGVKPDGTVVEVPQEGERYLGTRFKEIQAARASNRREANLLVLAEQVAGGDPGENSHPLIYRITLAVKRKSSIYTHIAILHNNVL